MSTNPRGQLGAGSRAGSWVLAGVFLTACAVSVALVNIIASQTLTDRIDVTASGDHELGERLLGLLDSLEDDATLILAGPWSAGREAQASQALPGPDSIRRAFDALEEIDRASSLFELRALDTSTPSGRGRFFREIERLAQRDRGEIAALRESIDGAIELSGTLSDSLDLVAERLRAMASERGIDASVSRALQRLAAEAGAGASRMRQHAADTRAAADEPIGTLGIDALDRGLEAARSMLGRGQGQLERLERAGEVVADAVMDDIELRDPIDEIARAIGGMRDRAAVLADRLQRARVPPAVRVARTLLTGNGAVLVGGAADGPGIVAIGFDALFGTLGIGRQGAGPSVVDAGALAEDAVANALAVATRPDRPIVVLVHGEVQRWVMSSSALESFRERLAMRGMDLLEWPAAIQPDPPNPRSVPGGDRRPVVYLVMSTSSVRVSGVEEGMNGPARAAAVGEALRWIVDGGHPVLLAAHVSWPASAYDGADPQTAWLYGFGLVADPARAVVTRVPTAAGEVLEFAHRVLPVSGAHPLQRAVEGLPIALRWPIALESTAEVPDGVVTLERTALVRIDADRTWAEREWQPMWEAAQRSDADSLMGPGLAAPTPGIDDTTGPWTVAWAVERRVRGGGQPQRAVVVGSNRWFVDAATTPMRAQDGRLVRENPGNRPLLESSIAWLAGQDEMVAADASSRPVARIRSLSAGEMVGIGWAVVIVPPILVVLLGVIFRLVRG